MDATHKHDVSSGGHDGAGRRIETVDHLVEHLAEVLCPGAAVVCVGNELCGDDGAGVAVARGLGGKVPWDVFDTQSVPESFVMKIAARKPGRVVLVDALDFGACPGAVELVEPEGLSGQGPSTHGPAPLAFLELLRMIHPCRCAVLGIQPQQADFGAALSEPVRAAVDMVVEAFHRLATSAGGGRN